MSRVKLSAKTIMQLVGLLVFLISTTVVLFSLSNSDTVAFGEEIDRLSIISPHRKSVQQEFVPAFKKYYQETFKRTVDVEWLDQGGTSDDVRFLRARFAKNPKTSGIDLLWGGGAPICVELANDDKILSTYKLPPDVRENIPRMAGGVELFDETSTWYGTALSSFGIFFNKRLLPFEKIEAPKTWEDLASPAFYNHITLTDPRRSGTATVMNLIVLQGMGWQKGWETLTSIAANTKRFTHSSSDPIKAVVSGDTVAAMAVDFYANAKIGDLGSKNLGFTLPEGQTILNADPIAILKGAPNRLVAERFINFALSTKAQKLLILPRGHKDGPKFTALGRMAVSPKAYDETEGKRTNELNPFKLKSFLNIDPDRMALVQQAYIDLVGALHIDTQPALKRAWKKLISTNEHKTRISELSKPPITEKQLIEYAEKWDDNLFRNKKINEWVEFARQKYAKI